MYYVQRDGFALAYWVDAGERVTFDLVEDLTMRRR
jgi:hypothetical protein